MSVDQTDVVDAIGIEKQSGDVILTVTDHLGWCESEKEHLFLLQEKLNTYLRFVESGEILEAYPEAKGRGVVIEIVCKYPPSMQGRDFIDRVAGVVRSAGVGLRHQVLQSE
jgi:hypothetical protein